MQAFGTMHFSYLSTTHAYEAQATQRLSFPDPLLLIITSSSVAHTVIAH